ncbi:MAG: cell division protein SepF [Methanobrevibacter sp.]|nr:cell division protein SepF [Methanobrevibacter sp.]
MSFTDNLKKSLGFEEDPYGMSYSDDGFDDSFLDDDFTISPEQSFYEIILIKPQSIDDMDYVFDQVVEENNPVILDLIHLEKQGVAEFRKAGERLKVLREQYNAQAILLAQSSEKNLIIVTPSRVKLVRKD